MKPNQPPKHNTRPIYNQVRMAMREGVSGMGHPLGPNTDGTPKPKFFQATTPQGDGYAKRLGKSQTPLGTLVGIHRAEEGYDTGQRRSMEREKEFGQHWWIKRRRQ